jgi:hypothetical protein
MIIRLKEEKKFKSGSVKTDIAVEIDDVFKLLTRAYMSDGDKSVGLGPLDRDGVATALSKELDDCEIVWCEGLWRFAVNWYAKKDNKQPVLAEWKPYGNSNMNCGYSDKWGTVETIKAALPAHVVQALERLNTVKEIRVVSS